MALTYDGHNALNGLTPGQNGHLTKMLDPWIKVHWWVTRSQISDKPLYVQINGLVQERHNSIANALELHLSCTNPSKWWPNYVMWCHMASLDHNTPLPSKCSSCVYMGPQWTSSGHQLTEKFTIFFNLLFFLWIHIIFVGHITSKTMEFLQSVNSHWWQLKVVGMSQHSLQFI